MMKIQLGTDQRWERWQAEAIRAVRRGNLSAAETAILQRRELQEAFERLINLRRNEE